MRSFEKRDHQRSIPKIRIDQLTSILIDSDHKTYKYICVNGILGKATANLNPLVLQVQSNLPRSWDARSVCHKVLCPFELKYLGNRLGGSNEPFLNKPARFTELSETNAVRGGKNKNTLLILINFFKFIDTLKPNDAEHYLSLALKLLMQLQPMGERLHGLNLAHQDIHLYEAINTFLEENLEGQTMTLITYGLFADFYKESHFRLVPHKLNQSGASSKECADLDIFSKDSFVCGIEIKDKEFSLNDISHAKRKVELNEGRFIFITREKYKAEFAKNNPNESDLHKKVISIESMVSLHEGLCLNDAEVFFKNLKKCANEINVSDSVIERISSIFAS